MIFVAPPQARCASAWSTGRSAPIQRPLLRQGLFSKATRELFAKTFHISLESFNCRVLSRFLKRNAVDVVLAEYGPIAVAVMNSCEESGIPLVAHFHGYDAHSQPTVSEYKERYGVLFAKAAAVIAVSRTMAQALLALGVSANKLHINSCGVDVNVFEGAKPASAPPNFIAVGRFVDKKAPHLVLLAFAKVRASCTDTRLTMAGDGPLWESCKQLANALGVANAVEFAGVVSHDQVRFLMKHARALVQHSVTTTYGDSEGTPVAVLEASSAGLPVVATQHAGIQDAVLHERTGFLVAERDVDAMAEYMVRLVRDAALAAALGAAGRKFVADNYSSDRSIRRLYEILQEAVFHARR
jgi:colanic acid/amylovoran biosynthesis glycosyltransferase